MIKKERWVIKIGSALLTNNGTHLDVDAIKNWVSQIAAIRQLGIEVLLVSSGAVAAGLTKLNWSERPTAMSQLQAAAAIGQMSLVQTYEACFQLYDTLTAQVLVTHDDLSDRTRYLNARSSLLELLALQVVPIVNENDTVVTEEIRFGDNDTLAALVTNLVEAQRLIILTDQNGLFDADPRHNPNAKMITKERANNSELLKMATPVSGRLGRGGMTTKVKAAGLAARSGAFTVIANGRSDRVIERLAQGESLGTLLMPDTEPMAARKQWLAGHLQMRGVLVIDQGAVEKLRVAGSSLLPVGVKRVEGEFERGDMVECQTESGERIACGLVNYRADEAKSIAGLPSQKIRDVLNYVDQSELIHRDNMVVF